MSQVQEIPPGLYPAMILHGGLEILQSQTNYGNGIRYLLVVSFTTSIGYGIEDEGLILPEQVDDTSVPSLLALRWIRECLRTLIEEQQDGIHEKMAEIDVYVAILKRLKRGRGE
ncbi:hypothetical protein EDB19DRAFT_1911683 [Suillus lakei]|nr:hypothetical protein EDB19DRAFT_1911683 [Suillus lakei]